MFIDCKKMSDEVRAKIRSAVVGSRKKIRLAIVKASHGDAAQDVETEAFLKQKQKCGAEVGIDVREYDVSDFLFSQTALENRISVIARLRKNDAVIIQLPLPPLRKKTGEIVSANTQAACNRVPPKKDADGLCADAIGRYEAGSETALTPPAVGAMEEILRQKAPDIFAHLAEQRVVAVGQGLVIGKQVNRWAVRNHMMEFSGLRRGSDIRRFTEHADIIVSGVGKAGLITPDMVQMGATIFDFGFSKENGIIRGDVDLAVANKARILTPVPGGMGPFAVTMLFWNVARIVGVEFDR